MERFDAIQNRSAIKIVEDAFSRHSRLTHAKWFPAPLPTLSAHGMGFVFTGSSGGVRATSPGQVNGQRVIEQNGHH